MIKKYLSGYLGSSEFRIKFLMTFCLITAIFFVSLKNKHSDPSTYRYITTGKIISETKTFPIRDCFSFTTNNKIWIIYDWLNCVIFYFFDKYLGFNRLILFGGLLFTLTFVIVMKTCQLNSNNYNLVFLVTSLAALSSAGSANIRPQLFSYLFFSIFVLIFWKYRISKNIKYFWWTAPIMLFWVNMHVLFISGLLFLGVIMLSEFLKTKINLPSSAEVIPSYDMKILTKILLVNIAVCFINPYTYKIFIPIYQYLTGGALSCFVEEHSSPDFHLIQTKFFEALILLSLLFIYSVKKRFDVTVLFFTLAFLHFSLQSIKYIPFFAIFIAPVLCSQLPLKQKTTVDKPLKIRSHILNIVIISFAIGLIYTKMNILLTNKDYLDESGIPVKATEFLKTQNIKGNILNHYNIGGYLIYHLYPNHKVSIDDRSNLYYDGFFKEYMQISSMDEGWEKILKHYDIKTIIWPKADFLSKFILVNQNWKTIYTDDDFIIFVEKNGIFLRSPYSN